MFRVSAISLARAAIIGVCLTVTIPLARSAAQCSGTCRFEVQPQLGYVTRVANTSGFVDTFTVKNVGPYDEGGSLQCAVSGQLSCTGTNPTGFYILRGQQIKVAVTYSTLAAGSGLLTLNAYYGSGYSWGNYSVTVNPPPVYTVAVTPDGDSTLAHQPNTSGYSEVFTVRNTGNMADTWTISCGGTVNVACTGTDKSSVSPSPGTSTPVIANYSVGTVGVGTLTLTATSAHSNNSGSYTVPVRTFTPQTPIVIVDSVNSGATVARDQCLTIAMAPAAAGECGDLRVVHALPTTRTLNKPRTPTLFYNSSFAHPYPVVRAQITLPMNAEAPLRYDAKLWNCAAPPCTLLASGSWTGSEWSAGQTRQVALGYDAVAQSQGTGVYTQTMEVTAVYASTTFIVAQTLQTVVVDRRSSPFGAGWWIAGVEQLNVGSMLWVGGDGSVRQYTPVTGQSNTWVAPSMSFPDTLRLVGSYYIRYLPGRLRVYFDLSGKHVLTVNRLSDTTSFSYSGTQLASITLPPASLGRVYQFTYPPNQVSIASPGSAGLTRTTTITLTTGRLTQLQDPDGYSTTFTYSGSTPELLVGRTDKLGRVVNYAYDGAQRVATSTQVMAAGQANIVRSITVAETRGLNGTASVDADRAYTRFDGPRSDVADTITILVNRYGAPRVVTDAFGGTTRASRADTRSPGLVTLVVSANGRKQSVMYDGRGNGISTTDSSTTHNGVYATTQYQWDATCDEITRTTLPEGEVKDVSYDPSNCNKQWQQDTRGPTSRITFTYYGSGVAKGLLATSQTPLVPATNYAYDSYGNLLSVTTPRGFTTTSYKDALGRDTLVVSPVDSATPRFQLTRTIYDVMDRVQSSVSKGDNQSGADSIITTRHYDLEGRFTDLTRLAGPDLANIGSSTTQWRYDYAGRPVAEVAPDGYVDSTSYDAAGNAIATVTRRGHTIEMQYDALDRITLRIVPDVSKLDTTANGWHFPYYALPSFVDTARFAYDIVGNLIRAGNRDALIRRLYNQNGTILADTLKIRTYAELSAGGDTISHVYGNRYGYDLDGRRIYLLVPHQLGARFPGAPTVMYDSIAYSYSNFGALASVRDVLGNVFRYVYDLDGRLDTLYYPLGDFKHYTYNADGSPLTIQEDRTATGNQSENNLIQAKYDPRGKIINLFPNSNSWGWEPLAYYGLGSLRSTEHKSLVYMGITPRDQWNNYSVDASGNIVDLTTNYTYSYYRSGCGSDPQYVTGDSRHPRHYAPGTARLLSVDHSTNDHETDSAPNCGDIYTGSVTAEVHRYDRAGNEYWGSLVGRDSTSGDCLFGCNWRPTNHTTRLAAKYYDAAGRLRTVDVRVSSDFSERPLYQTPPGFEEYRYDALGRRILHRARQTRSAELIERFIWDGDHLLAEIQMPGSDAMTPIQLERDTAAAVASNSWGRVIYLTGEGIDRPISIVRIDFAGTVGGTTQVWNPYALIPHWDIQRRIYDQASYGPTNICKTVNGDTRCARPLRWPERDSYGMSIGGGDQYIDGVLGGWWGSLAQDQMDPTGDLYRRNRYYDQQTGRFTQEDPVGLAGGANLYAVTDNDPVSFSDPFGLCEGWDITYDANGCVLRRVENNLDHDRFFLAANGIVYDMTADMDPVTVTPPDDRDIWQKTGDFAAGFGDFWTFGGTQAIREAFVCNTCVNYNSDQYFFGQVTAAASGFVVGEGAAAGEVVTQFKAAYHATPHPFRWLGAKLAHLQLNWWVPGVKGSGGVIRIPLPW